MTDNARVEELLDELFGSHATPEEVCRSCPEFLPIVRARWQRMCRVRAALDELLPAAPAQFQQDTAEHVGNAGSATPPSFPPDSSALPQIPGYEVEAVLGRGGMGVVYKARHLQLNRPVALKMLLAGAYAGREERSRFQQEAEAIAGLRHPHVVRVYEVGDLEGPPALTMEFVDGGVAGMAGVLAASVPGTGRHSGGRRGLPMSGSSTAT